MDASDASALARLPLFQDLDPADLAGLAASLRRRRYARAETVFLAGDPGTNLCVVKSGHVKLALTSEDGREVILALLGPGEVFGEMALFDGEPRSADAVATEQTELLLLARDAFVRSLERSPSLAIQVIRVLAQRLRANNQLRQDSALLDVPARLARLILMLAEARKGEQPTTPRLTQSDLAGMAGTTRETLNKWIGLFEDQGLIRRDGGRIVVLEPERLRRRIY